MWHFAAALGRDLTEGDMSLLRKIQRDLMELEARRGRPGLAEAIKVGWRAIHQRKGDR